MMQKQKPCKISRNYVDLLQSFDITIYNHKTQIFLAPLVPYVWPTPGMFLTLLLDCHLSPSIEKVEGPNLMWAAQLGPIGDPKVIIGHLYEWNWAEAHGSFSIDLWIILSWIA